MMMPEYKAPDRAGLRKFGLTVGLIFIGLFGLALPLWKHHPISVWPHVVGGPLVVLGLVAPMTLAPVHKGWMKLGGVLGFVNSRIILSLLFFIVVTPMGVLRRLLGKDSLGRRFDKGAASYRTPSTVVGRERMKDPF